MRGFEGWLFGALLWFKRLFCCEHAWLTHFRGQFTRGVECTKCGKLDLLEDFNDGSEPIGWRIEP